MKNLLIVIVLTLLTGCSTTKVVKEYVVQTKFITMDIPSVLLQTCLVPTPPDKMEYLNAPVKQKETMLTSYIISLHGDLDSCSMKIDGIRKIQTDLKKKVEEINAKIIQ